eukprot:CAMPEP_0114987156 /NCGR_PEP_ID=MMETSP0216-20121206/8844_1 /TAXON_ID=223996 /ORGANISM="Protocruzia adherens, Strain Boccale" /LENGTH=273 /DNA_ID=CAMNT_0002349709 /DNA_START=288 /DNA_END=1109 /DNA_ORIENTATION=-
MDFIVDGLYQGSMYEAKSKKTLQKNGITHILAVGTYLKICFPKDYEYLHISVHDSPDSNLYRFFEQSNAFIEKAITSGGKVLVHCALGVCRSSSLVLAYIIKNKDMSFKRAYDYLREQRQRANPNRGFIEQLKIFSKVTRNSAPLDEVEKKQLEVMTKLRWRTREVLAAEARTEAEAKLYARKAKKIIPNRFTPAVSTITNRQATGRGEEEEKKQSSRLPKNIEAAKRVRQPVLERRNKVSTKKSSIPDSEGIAADNTKEMKEEQCRDDNSTR